jgi:endogenous inhibitor of DNA gyrase (YacG/DUF329 family)
MRAAPRHLCPICGRDAPQRRTADDPARASSFFPFCGPACKLVDLGRWLDGGYSIPGDPSSVEAPSTSDADDDVGDRE